MNAEGTSKAMVLEPTVMGEITRGEIDMQIATARRYPRSIDAFQKKALSLATVNQDIAARCFYKLPRGGKVIEGPSIRLAEICLGAWGNLRGGAQCIEVGEAWIKSQGVAHDLETNTAISVQTVRRITDKNGKRYSDDMIIVTQNANNAIALRNAAFKIIPYVYVNEIFLKVKQVAVGDTKTMGPRRKQALEKYAELKVDEARVLKFLKRRAVEDIDLGDLEMLFGVYTAIKDGDTTVEEQFKVANGKPIVDMPEDTGAPEVKTVVSNGRPPLTAVVETARPPLTSVADPVPKTTGEPILPLDDEPGRESEEAPRKVVEEPQRIMHKSQFAVNYGIVISKLHASGWSDDLIRKEMAIKGFPSKFDDVAEGQRKDVITFLEGMVQ